uniref:Sema domain-containing protein n=1 Tax=Rhabditophanes sp. KR3021 TaxID=114890 RepID=A0AC35TU52_9BILA
MWRLLLFFIVLNECSANSYTIFPDNTFTAGSLQYNSLKLDAKSASLYVTGQNHLFRLWIYNINDTSSESLYAAKKFSVEDDDKEECIQLGNTEAECANWIREIFQTANGDLLVCASSAMKPMLIKLNGLVLNVLEEPQIAIGVCSPNAQINASAIYVEQGNPDNLPAIYSGIRTGLSQENHLIYRPPLIKNGKEVYSSMRSVYTDSKWLNDPQFVGSYEVGKYVYFFFRETAVEFEGCGKTVYSRVARICKNDLGGKNVMKQVWTSFVKARLNCSLSTSTFPYYFDHIESISRVNTNNDVHFYASMRTSESPFQGSAVCVYSLNQINQIFDTGIFLEQPTPNSQWIQTPPEQVQGKRPGSCAADSRTFSDSDLHFARNHLLMADSVSGKEPLIYERDKLFSTVLVDTLDKDNGHVLFISVPSDQEIMKVAITHNTNGKVITRKLATLKLSTFTKVNALTLMPNEYLFAADDQKVAQFRLAQCDAYEGGCAECTADPYCSWNIVREQCFSSEKQHKTTVGWISGTENIEKCNSRIKAVEKLIYPGDALFLKGKQKSIWKKNGKDVLENEHTLIAQNGGLIILNATAEQIGTYECYYESIKAFMYHVEVDTEDCAQPKTVNQFRSIQREWCRKFDNYKDSLSRWQNWYDANAYCEKIPEQLLGKPAPPTNKIRHVKRNI